MADSLGIDYDPDELWIPPETFGEQAAPNERGRRKLRRAIYEERWRRVEQRNEHQGETFRIKVTRPMFDYIETIWQPPTPEELSALDGVRIAA